MTRWETRKVTRALTLSIVAITKALGHVAHVAIVPNSAWRNGQLQRGCWPRLAIRSTSGLCFVKKQNSRKY